MANIMGSVEIRTAEYRPCYVYGRKALFHRWTDVAMLSPSKALVYGNTKEAEDIATLAIVEFEDGTVERVFPESVRFVPGIMNEYNFMEGAENETCNATD